MTILILSGTGEGREIAAKLHQNAVSLIASLAGATRNPSDQAVQTRIGGFGGASGFETYLKGHEITAVLDATHPFARDISQRSHKICTVLNIPYCLFARPAWVATERDLWTSLADETEAAVHIKPSSTVFLATGRKTLNKFENLSNCRLICRQIDPPDGLFPFPNGEFLIGRPPFSTADEIALFRQLEVDWLVVKNAGGTASFSKLEAARELGLHVGMIERPDMPDAKTVTTVKHAIEWGLTHG
ncbi:MAG: cobalt-precorrin-6A reductase [Planktotalea sp.]|uniref:cobalt-precorrin-6A reductase n=1 Tax=Planktotalea sp. TaxID=2029877 RepID=UPI00260AE04C|nr:cobalt-precorrin-6A reductase [Planktotalea sp.]MDG1083213.1 cobalt-precorrin-6A reductase [Planktotalea sp.]